MADVASACVDLANEIRSRAADWVERRALKPAHEPRGYYPSSLGDCSRQIFYDRALWPWRHGLPASIQARLEIGNVIHEWTARHLGSLGLVVTDIELQMMFKKWDMSGRIDLVVQHGDARVPVEIKSIADSATSKLSNLQAHWFTRKYLRQIRVYMEYMDVDAGLLLFAAVPSGVLTPVVVTHDDESRAELHALLGPCLVSWDQWAASGQDKRVLDSTMVEASDAHEIEIAARDAAEAVAPPRIADTSECGRCQWFSQCLPHRAQKATMAEWDDLVAVGSVTRLAEIWDEESELRSEKDALRETLMALFDQRCGPEITSVRVGRYMVPIKTGAMTRCSPPKEVIAEHPEWMKKTAWRSIGKPARPAEPVDADFDAQRNAGVAGERAASIIENAAAEDQRQKHANRRGAKNR